MAIKYYFLNENQSKLIFYNYFRQSSFHETDNIYDLIVSSYVERSPVAFPC